MLSDAGEKLSQLPSVEEFDGQASRVRLQTKNIEIDIIVYPLCQQQFFLRGRAFPYFSEQSAEHLIDLFGSGLLAAAEEEGAEEVDTFLGIVAAGRPVDCRNIVYGLMMIPVGKKRVQREGVSLHGVL